MRFAKTLASVIAFSSVLAQSQLSWDYKTAMRMVDYAYAGQCLPADIQAWDCIYCVNDTTGFQTIGVNYNASTDHTAYIGVNPNFQELLVSFRGTKPTSLNNWLNNLDVFSSNKAFPWYTDAMVHPGFLDVLESHQSFLIPQVPNLIAMYPNYQLVINGHSLGGAVATMFAMQLFVEYGTSSTHLVTFGSPRVGDGTFRDLFTSSGVSHWRLTHERDPVPHVPLEAWGYIHVPGEIWEVESSGVSNFTVCSDADAEDATCSDSNWFDIDISDHKTYMLVTSGACSSP